MTAEDPHTPTCGMGLAHHGTLIELVARFAIENAGVLESHLPMLDESDKVSAEEGRLYRELVRELREAGTLLRSASARMLSARDMPMGPHVDSQEANAGMAAAFQRFVDAEAALARTIPERVAGDQAMLREWGDQESQA